MALSILSWWVAHSIMSLKSSRLREGHLTYFAVEWARASMSSLVHDEIRALVKNLVTSSVSAHIQGALPLCLPVQGFDALAGQRVNQVWSVITCLLACFTFAFLLTLLKTLRLFQRAWPACNYIKLLIALVSLLQIIVLIRGVLRSRTVGLVLMCILNPIHFIESQPKFILGLELDIFHLRQLVMIILLR